MGAKAQGADATLNRWLTVARTLCFITHGTDVLLMKRADNRRIFPGYYNGIGGHLERDEDPLNGARREIREETGLEVHAICFRGAYNIDTGGDTGILLFIFTAESSTRDLIDSEEGTLHWIPIQEVLKLKVVEDLPVVWPRLFGNKPDVDAPFFAHLSYDSQDRMVMRFAEEKV